MKKSIYASLSCLALTILVSLTACNKTPDEPATPAEPTCDLALNKKGGVKSFDVSYNAQHLMTKFSYYDAAGSVTSSYDFSYDGNGRVTTQAGKDAAGVSTQRVDLIYGSNNKIFQIKSYNSAGEQTSQTTQEYDSDGRCTRKSSLSFTAGVSSASGYTVIEYSGSSKYPTRAIYTPQPTGMRTITTFTYDANGNMTESVRFDAPIGGQSIQRYRYQYTYDNKKLVALNLAGYARVGYDSGANENFIANKNNRTLETQISYDVLGNETNRSVSSYVYEYNSDGYPTKRTYTPSSGANVIDTYEYHCH